MAKKSNAKKSYKNPKQLKLIPENYKHKYCHGGRLRSKAAGRKFRPLSSKEPLHLVFKANKEILSRKSFRASKEFMLVKAIMVRYAKMFSIKVEQVSIQHDHIHCLIRTGHRNQFQHFFRVVAGQIAQRFESEGLLKAAAVSGTPQFSEGATKLWKYRPFSRVVRGFKALLTVRNYIQLNEKEVRREIQYKKQRLKGLSSFEWEILWS